MIDRFACTNKLNKVNPVIKVLVSLIPLISVFLIHQPLYMVAVFMIMVGLTIGVAKIPKKIFFHTLLFDSIFIIPGVLALLFTISQGETGYLWSFRFLGLMIGMTADNIELAQLVFLRAMSGVSCMLFLIYTTSATQIAEVLKKAHISNTFLEIFILTYRFIFDYWNKVKLMVIAQNLRFGYCGLRTTVRSLGMIVSNLFFIAMDSYEGMTKTLELKQFQGDFHIGVKEG
ncbi:MAG: cobalt ECF transporter T component CbiQ [Eubacteriaceae bacterium]